MLKLVTIICSVILINTIPAAPKVNTYANNAWCPPPSKCQQDPILSTDNVVMVDIDEPELIKNNKKEGRYFICYISVGSVESYRSDAKDFPAAALYGPYKGFPDETWLDVTMWKTYSSIMKKRMDFGVANGCDAFEYDNDSFNTNESKKLYKQADLDAAQIEYNIWLSQTAAAMGKGSFLKNANDIAVRLEPYYTGVIFEECIQYDACQPFKAYTDKGKPVLGTEYSGDFDKICKTGASLDFDMLVYDSVKLGHWKKCPTYTKANAKIMAPEISVNQTDIVIPSSSTDTTSGSDSANIFMNGFLILGSVFILLG